MKRIKYILFILTILLSLNAFSQTTIVELSNKDGSGIHIVEGSTIHIDTIRLQMLDDNFYQFRIDDVKAFVESDSIELRVDVIGYKPVKQKFLLVNNHIYIELEEKQYITTLLNDSLVEIPYPTALGVELNDDENLCIIVSGLIESASLLLSIYNNNVKYSLCDNLSRLIFDSISQEIFIPKCEYDGSAYTNFSRNSNVSGNDKIFLLCEISITDTLVVTDKAKIYEVAKRVFFQDYDFLFIALDKGKNYSFFSSSLYVEISNRKSKRDILSVIPVKQEIRKYKNGYLIDLNEDIKRGFQYWIDYYSSFQLCSTITLNQITL